MLFNVKHENERSVVPVATSIYCHISILQENKLFNQNGDFYS